MARPRPVRDPERGNSMVLALIVLSALATLGGLTVVSVQSSLKASTNDRGQQIALYAAETGAAVAISYLRPNFDPGGDAWSAYVRQNNNPVFSFTAAQIPSNNALPGTANNVFTADQDAWYEISVLNNFDDPRFGNGGHPDGDGRITLRVTGHGPLGALAILEWDLLGTAVNAPVTLLGWRIVSL
jgi:hypothetical protein